MNLTERESRIVELFRLLVRNDPAFAHLPAVIHECLETMYQRGQEYNGETLGCMDLNYMDGDREAIIHIKRPFFRALQATRKHGAYIPDRLYDNSGRDLINYSLIWGCCRREKHGGQAHGE